MAAPTRNLFSNIAGNAGTLAWTPSLTAMATGAAVGDTIVLLVAADGNPTLSLSAGSITAGWLIDDQDPDATNACRASVLRFPVTVAGTVPDPTINLTASEAIVGQAIRVRPSSGNTLVFLTPTQSQGSSVNPDPPSITQSTGAARDILYIAFWGGDGIVLSTAAGTNYANHQSTSISNAANGSSVGTMDRTRAAVANAGAEDPPVFTRATEQWVAYTLAVYEVAPTAISANPVATPAPVITSGVVTQNHNLTGTAVATPAPSLGSPAIGQTHTLSGAAIATPAPAIASPAMGQTHTLAAVAVTTPAPQIALGTAGVTYALAGQAVATPAPAVGTGTMGQTHGVAATAIATPAPQLGVGPMTQTHSLVGLALAAGPPAVASPAIGQTHSLVADAITTPAPAIGLGVLSQVHAVTALGISTTAPQIAAPAVGQVHQLVAVPLATPAPAVGMGVLSQVHGLGTLDVATGPPVIDSPAVGQTHALAATAVATPAPQIGSPAVSQPDGTYHLTATPIGTPAPAIGVPAIVQTHQLTALGIATPAPQLGTTATGQVHVLAGQPIAAPAPVVGQPDVGQVHAITALAVETPPPQLGQPGIISGEIIDQPPTVSRARVGLTTESTPRRLYSYSRPRSVDDQGVVPMPSHRWGAKDPDEVVSYTHDWAAVLVDGDEVVGQPEAVVESCDAVVDLSVMKTATVQRVRVSGGSPGRCKITIGIHTVLGNYWQEGIILPIREQ